MNFASAHELFHVARNVTPSSFLFLNKHIHHTRIDSSSFVAEQNFPLHLEFPPLLISLIHESSARRFIASRSRIVVPSCSFFPVDRNYRELPLSLNIQFFAIEFSSRREEEEDGIKEGRNVPARKSNPSRNEKRGVHPSPPSSSKAYTRVRGGTENRCSFLDRSSLIRSNDSRPMI